MRTPWHNRQTMARVSSFGGRMRLATICLFAASATAHADERASSNEMSRLSSAFAHVAGVVGPSVVQIETTMRVPDAFGPIRRAMGSGVVFSKDGVIVTNHHVVENALAIYVKLSDGRKLTARVVGTDEATDLAVLRVEAKGLVPARFSDTRRTRVGEWVVAVGSPFGLGSSVTAGILSAKGRGGLGMSAIEDYLQTDASINPGNSGGPLATLDGTVLGINTMVVDKGNGVGFAIPSSIVRRVVDRIQREGSVHRGSIGLTVQDLSVDLAHAMKLGVAEGAIVSAVSEGGPASGAGILPGDVITKANDKSIEGERDLVREVLEHAPGDTIDLAILRDNKRISTKIVLAPRLEARREERPAPSPLVSPNDTFGIVVRELDEMQSKQLGLPEKRLAYVARVAIASPADRAGLHEGDVIVDADGRPFPTPSELQDAAKDGEVWVRVQRGSKSAPAFFFAVLKR